MKDRIAKFVKERNEVLFSLDRQRIEAYMTSRGLSCPKNDTVFWAGIYKSICNIPNAPADIRTKASVWLKEHGMQEMVSYYGHNLIG